MATSAELNLLTARQLGSIAKELAVHGWHDMRKEDLVRSLIAKSRSKNSGERLKQFLKSAKPAPPKSTPPTTTKTTTKQKTKYSPVLISGSSKSSAGTTAANNKSANNKTASNIPANNKNASATNIGNSKSRESRGGVKVVVKDVVVKSVPELKKPEADAKGKTAKKTEARSTKTTKSDLSQRDRRKEVPRKLETKPSDFIRNDNAAIVSERTRLSRDLGTADTTIQEDQLALTVRGPFWLHAFWQLSSRTIERLRVSMGHYWYTALPILRVFKIDPDLPTREQRQVIRQIKVHGGVRHWYIDVSDPPSMFQAELGYLSKDRKFHLLVTSNTVETPPRQIVDDLDKLDDNWREVDENLARIYKLTAGETNNSDLKRVFEKQLKRPMSAPLLSRYRSTGQKGGGVVKTKRNFLFTVDADIIIHGKIDPSVQLTVKNEPITVNSDGTFSVRFSIPEKRHVFPIEAEGSDGVEVQRVILTMERNTRVLETLFQEPSDDD